MNCKFCGAPASMEPEILTHMTLIHFACHSAVAISPDSAPLWSQDNDCRERELARIKSERDSWKAVAEMLASNAVCLCYSLPTNKKCSRCQALTEFNQLKSK